MNERLSPGEQLAGVAGLVLILVMFLFAWFTIDLPNVNGFDAFDAFRQKLSAANRAIRDFATPSGRRDRSTAGGRKSRGID